MSKIPVYMQLRSDPSVPLAVKGWLNHIDHAMMNLSFDRALAAIGMGVEIQGDCNCESLGGNDDPLWQWMHANHRRYNRAVWELIDRSCHRNTLWQGLLTQCKARQLGEEYDWQLLTHFLRGDPNPEWVGQGE